MPESITPVTELELDSTSLQESPFGIHLEILHGLNEIPKVRGVDVVAAHRTGRIAYPRLADVLSLELFGYIAAIGMDYAAQKADFRTRADALKSLLTSSSLNVVVLSCTLEDGANAAINVRVVDYQVTERIPSVVAEVRVALESIDPYWVVTPAGS